MEATVATRQRTVVIGIVLGVAGIASIVATDLALVPLREVPPIAERLAFAARCALFPTLMFACGIAVVGSARFGGQQMDPLSREEVSRALLVHQRYLQNTLEQLAIHLVALVGLAVDGAALGMRLLPALAATFVVGRAVYWLGYLRGPLQRSPGFTMTFYPTVFTLAYLAARSLGVV